MKKILNAFLVGAGCGIVGQLIMTVIGSFVRDPNMVTLISMFLFGVIAVAVIASGAYNKIAMFGGDGAAIPLCGLMFGAAMARAGAQKSGAPAGKAFGVGFMTILKVLGTGFVISFIIGLLWRPSGPAPELAAVNPVLKFLFAAVICGVICAVTQLLASKLPFPAVAIFMTVLGSVLTPLGVMDMLANLGAGGTSVTAMGCGNGAYGAANAVLAGQIPAAVMIVALNLALIAMGALAGGLLLKKHSELIGPPPAADGEQH